MIAASRSRLYIRGAAEEEPRSRLNSTFEKDKSWVLGNSQDSDIRLVRLMSSGRTPHLYYKSTIFLLKRKLFGKNFRKNVVKS